MAEVWKAVPGYEGLYEVSDQGRVRSVDRVVQCTDGRARHLQGKELTPYQEWSGHVYVFLGRKNRRKVHKLVAEAFMGPCPEGLVVRHLNGNPADNHVGNLAYGTQADNLHDCYSYGTKMGQGKLTAEQVHQIRDLLYLRVPQAVIAAQFGISQQSVSNIATKRTFNYID